MCHSQKQPAIAPKRQIAPSGWLVGPSISRRLRENLRDELPTARPATAAPNPGSDGQRSGATGKPESDREGLYGGIESFLCDAVHMAQIADDMVFESMDECDPNSLARLAFAVSHMLRQLMGELRKSVSATASNAEAVLEMEERAALAEDVADRLNDDEARREEDKWSA
jgi:hypothetical protein